MSITDIIPDIHGQAEKLRVALKNLGWWRNGTTWLHSEPSLLPDRAKVAKFYSARSEIITPLPWPTFALTFSQQAGWTRPL